MRSRSAPANPNAVFREASSLNSSTAPRATARGTGAITRITVAIPGKRYSGPVKYGLGSNTGMRGKVREAGTKTSSMMTSLLSVPRIPNDRQVSSIRASSARITRAIMTGLFSIILGRSPSITTAERNSHLASWIVLASGPRPVMPKPPGTSTARCGGWNAAAWSVSGSAP